MAKKLIIETQVNTEQVDKAVSKLGELKIYQHVCSREGPDIQRSGLSLVGEGKSYRYLFVGTGTATNILRLVLQILLFM